MRRRAGLHAATALFLVGLATAVAGCGSDDREPAANDGDCLIALSYGGHRYDSSTAYVDTPVGQPVGAADEVGCESDPTVYGKVSIRAVEGVAPEIAVVVVSGTGADRAVTTYVRDDQPRDRAPDDWPVSLAPDAFE